MTAPGSRPRRAPSPTIVALAALVAGLALGVLAAGAVVSALLAPPLLARTPINATTAATLRAHADSTAASGAQLPMLRGLIVGLVPTNPVRAAADGEMLPLVAADAIPDIFNTVINVTGDMAVAAMIEPEAAVP